jgi:hypothetical protein
MKIAYINEFPEASQLQAFVQEYECTTAHADKLSLSLNKGKEEHVMAAYDHNRLVAIGFAPMHRAASIKMTDVHVLPAYAIRGIEANVDKLLWAECKFCSVALT